MDCDAEQNNAAKQSIAFAGRYGYELLRLVEAPTVSVTRSDTGFEFHTARSLAAFPLCQKVNIHIR